MSEASLTKGVRRAGRRLHSLSDAILLFRPTLSSLPRERVMVGFLEGDAGLIGVETVAEGSEAAAALPVSDILRRALVRGARALIVAHNHPSGSATPSLADIRATRTLAAGAAVVGLALVDHIVFAPCETYSFRAMGLL